MFYLAVAIVSRDVARLPECCEPENLAFRLTSGVLARDGDKGDTHVYLSDGACGTGFDICAGFGRLDGVQVALGLPPGMSV